MKMRLGRWKWLGVVGATLPLWIPAFAGMTNSVAGTIHPGSEFGTFFRTNRSCRRAPAHHGMKTEALIGGGIRVAFVPRLRPLEWHLCRVSAPWIPASAGKTRWVADMT